MKLDNQGSIANSLLAALSHDEYQQLLSGLEPVHVSLGEILHEPSELIRYVYFPIDCLISLLAVEENGMALEVGLVGREGMVGAVASESRASPVRALVQRSGMALQMNSVAFRRKFRQMPSLRDALYHYANNLMVQAMQIAVCSHFHMLEARLACSLLMTRYRGQSDAFHLTHEFLAHTLGVRRVGVTKAASALQQRKLISYSRGDIIILDGEKLEATSCGCYRIIKQSSIVKPGKHKAG